MAQRKINPAEVVNLYTPPSDLPEDATLALMKTKDMEAIRMVLPKEKDITEHSVDGQISVQCLEGKTEFSVEGEKHVLTSGDWLYLKRNQPHSLRAIRDSILLVTILFLNESAEEE
ncbi:cupin domain-containing protein [Fodinibius sp. AD559]|uniref:cupin domain-containing protein n=1 Tax=Fodinibius sp. AD559 TaxID=3424179 RepID=UPI0040468C00